MIKHVVKNLIGFCSNKVCLSEIYYIVESKNWVIFTLGQEIKKHIKQYKFKISLSDIGIRNSVVHYASINTFYSSLANIRKNNSNIIIVTWYHIVDGDERIDDILDNDRYVDIWHTSCSTTKNQLIELGINKNKIVIIPIGIDASLFEKECFVRPLNMREDLGISKDSIVIGSFQKDGIGWGEGNEPKLIKGPDIFCDVLEKLSVKYNIVALLTGPSRGFVKNNLQRHNIKYIHHCLSNPNDIVKYYKVLDYYLITSRVEGGPRQIAESWASGVPVISANVGMATDIVKHAKNGMLVKSQCVDEYVSNFDILIHNKKLRGMITKSAARDVKKYDWKILADEMAKMYTKSMEHISI